jgi:putative transposase
MNGWRIPAAAAPCPSQYASLCFGGGRPRVPDRRCADAIFYVLRTGCQWQALDQTELCAHSTAHDRFQEWVQAGVFLKLWQAGLEQFEETCGIDWQWLSMDGAMRHPRP